MRDAAGSGYDILIGISLMEPSDIQKYSICNLLFRPVQVRVSEGYSGSCPGEAKSRGGTSFTDCIESANAAQWIRYWAGPTIIKKGLKFEFYSFA